VLTIQGGGLGQGSVTGGSGAGSGDAYGGGIFLQGNETLTLSPASGQTLVISGDIADQTGNGGTGGNAGAGALDLTGAGTVVLGAASTFTGGITLGAGTLVLGAQGAAGTGAITFTNDPNLDFTIANAPTNTIDGFASGDTIDVTDLTGAPATATLGDGGVLAISYTGGGTLDLTFGDLPAGQGFTLASDGAGGTDITLSQICFMPGTRILTDRGEVPVEALRVGDQVMTLSGQGPLFKPVRWIGARRVDPMRHPRPELVHPIRIRAGAFGQNQPRRDLLVSQGHAMFLEGHLIQAGKLENGATVARDDSFSEVDYLHVELDAHDLLVAEGVAAESFIDVGNRGFFANAQGVVRLNALPDGRVYDDGLTLEGYCAPMAGKPVLAAARRRLHARLLELGWRRRPKAQAQPHLLADGQRIDPTAVAGRHHRFVLPRAAREVRLVSHAGSNHWNDPDNRDCRRLGLAVSSLTWRADNDGAAAVALEDPRLDQGWHALEWASDGRPFRWTDGAARLPPLGPGEIDVEITQVMTGWMAPESDPSAVSGAEGAAGMSARR
jgi:autotransporter-associated beta strand protein